MDSYPYSSQPPGRPPQRASAWGRVPLIPLALAALAFALLARNWFGAGSLLVPDAEPRPVMARGDLAADEKATIELFQLSSKSVVFITTSTVQGGFLDFNPTEMPLGAGSGIVWDEQGHVVTNFHVLENARRARVMLPDQGQSVYPAMLVGAAPDKDLAVLKISAPAGKLQPIPIGVSKDLQVGQKAFAIGNPFGLDQTLTTGVVSGLGLDTLLYSLAAIVGAGAAAYALGQFRRETWRYLGLCLATAGLLGVLIIIGVWAGDRTALPIAGRLGPDTLQGIESLLVLIPVMFVIEEVAFRGAIDSHVRPPGERPGIGSSTVYGIASAIVVSVLWGLWHLPITPRPPYESVILWVFAVTHLEVVVGPFLSLFWRRSGNLMVPGFSHATMDSVRDTLGIGV